MGRVGLPRAERPWKSKAHPSSGHPTMYRGPRTTVSAQTQTNVPASDSHMCECVFTDELQKTPPRSLAGFSLEIKCVFEKVRGRSSYAFRSATVTVCAGPTAVLVRHQRQNLVKVDGTRPAAHTGDRHGARAAAGPQAGREGGRGRGTDFFQMSVCPLVLSERHPGTPRGKCHSVALRPQ